MRRAARGPEARGEASHGTAVRGLAARWLPTRWRAGAAGLAGACVLLVCGVPSAQAERSLITVIDNSHADSVVEIDRTGNLQVGSGAAGSDHDGSGGLAGGLLGLGRPIPSGRGGR
ncbi:hypothetical protein ACGFZP_23895 [Kitasatospora sp. NPDC048239]|uniref:hypothetical protein n=1 Tax=Kitasatospora sp. NPDC048239 TaxID=3364046 RepID=UPI003715BA37